MGYIHNPNSQAWSAGEDIPANARVKLVVNADAPGGFEAQLADVGDLAAGLALTEAKEDTAENRVDKLVAITIRRIGFDAKSLILAGAALAAGDELLEGNDGTYVKNPGTLTGVAAEADDEKVTKVAHGLLTGHEVEFLSGTGFTGVTVGRRYFVSRFDADVFFLHLTLAEAKAGTGAVNITLDGSSGVFRVVSPVKGICQRAVAANKMTEAILF
jgi:hypothetical protein